jgi:hypothetical protein
LILFRAARCQSTTAAGFLVLEQLADLPPRKTPVDLGPLLVGFPVPGSGFPLQLPQIRQAPGSQTLPRKQVEFDLRLIELTSVFRGLVDRQPIP